MINSFEGKYEFLSNFALSPIEYEGIIYPTNEHFFQAMKTLNPEERKAIAGADTPGKAKRLGRKCHLRTDWEQVKEQVMLRGLRIKFSNPELREKLLATGSHELIEGTTWHDNEWGNCTCWKCRNKPGRNKLGKLLMQVREEVAEFDGKWHIWFSAGKEKPLMWDDYVLEFNTAASACRFLNEAIALDDDENTEEKYKYAFIDEDDYFKCDAPILDATYMYLTCNNYLGLEYY